MQVLKALCCTLLIGTAWGAPTPAPIRAEIDGLIRELRQGQCRLQRNGSWHNVDEAEKLLKHKLQAIEDKGTLRSTEEFIEQAATRSSTTGQPYQVQCGKEALQPSGTWLTTALHRVRKAK